MNRIKALVIEDEEVSGAVLTKSLEQLGVTVHQVSNLNQAFETISANLPSVIFLDLHLEDAKGGLEFLKLRKKITALQNVPVFIVSVSADFDTISNAMRQGADDYLIKPIIPELLKRMLAKHFVIAQDLNRA